MDFADEPITPAQTTFLKLLDAYLHANRTASDASAFAFLVPALHKLLLYAQSSLRASLHVTVENKRSLVPQPNAGSTAQIPELRSADARLPKVCEALVLVAQSVSMLLLRQSEQHINVLKSQLIDPSTESLELLVGAQPFITML